MAETCKLPPQGWICSRTPGHDGPCAATRYPAVGRIRYSLKGSPVTEYHDFDTFTMDLVAGEVRFARKGNQHVLELSQLQELIVHVPGFPDWRYLAPTR